MTGSSLIPELEKQMALLLADLERLGTWADEKLVKRVFQVRTHLNRVKQEEHFMALAHKRLARSDVFVIPVTHGPDIVYRIPHHLRRRRVRGRR